MKDLLTDADVATAAVVPKSARLSASLARTDTRSFDEAANQNNAARTLGVAPALVAAYPESALRKAEELNILKQTRFADATRELLARPEFRDLGKGDLFSLTNIERAVRGFLDGGPDPETKPNILSAMRPRDFAKAIDAAMRKNPALDREAARALVGQGTRFMSADEVGAEPWARPELSTSSALAAVTGGAYFTAQRQSAGLGLAIRDALGFSRQNEQRKYNIAADRADRLTPDTSSSAVKGAIGGGVSFIQNMPGLALGVAVGPAAGLTVLGLGAAADAYGKYTGRGATGGEAALGATLEGGIEAATELLPMSYALKTLGKTGVQGWLRGWLGRDMPTEQLATLAQDAVDTAIANPNKTWADYWKERPGAAAETFFATLAQGGLMKGTHAAIQKIANRGAYTEDQAALAGILQDQFIKRVAQHAEASKLNEKSKGDFETFMQAVEQDAPIKDLYIDASKLAAVFQQTGADLETIKATVPSIGAQYDQAVESGGQVRIPVSEFASRVVGQDFAQPLIEHLRAGETAMSTAEAKEYMAEHQERMQQEMAQALDELKGDERLNAGREAYKQQMIDELNAANVYPKHVNEVLAEGHANVYSVLAARAGIPLDEFVKRYDIKVADAIGGREAYTEGARPGTVSVEGYHFSSAQRSSLSSAMFGTGLKGSGREEYLAAADQRRRHRISFYVDKGTGINPEAGVGGHAHRAQLHNLYDANADPLRLRTGDQAAFETAVLDRGFNGYVDRLEGTQSAQAVLLGSRSVNVDYLGQRTREKGRVLPGVLEAQIPAQGRDAVLEKFVAMGLPSGAMTREKWAEALKASPEVHDAFAAAGVLSGNMNETLYRSELTAAFKRATVAPAYGQGDGLVGLPTPVVVDGVSVDFGPFALAQDAARKYMESVGLPYSPQTNYVKVDPARAKRIADAFEAMRHEPENLEVRAAYAAMIQETLAQWEAIKATGLKVEFIEGDDPYGNPRNAILDVVNNNHLWVYPTQAGFGGTESLDVGIKGNPLLAVVEGETISGRPVQVNDIFRIVHDYFGHIKDGVGFRADGEENAWRSHAAMYSPLARKAMTVETRGQNSWVNFGPFAERNRTANGADTQYAPQKIGLLPQWVVDDGATDTTYNQSAMTVSGDRVMAWIGLPEAVRAHQWGLMTQTQRDNAMALFREASDMSIGEVLVRAAGYEFESTYQEGDGEDNARIRVRRHGGVPFIVTYPTLESAYLSMAGITHPNMIAGQLEKLREDRPPTEAVAHTGPATRDDMLNWLGVTTDPTKFWDHLTEDQRALLESDFRVGGRKLLAPNGVRSNLTRAQWYQVRTPAFKEWFGDWEKGDIWNRSDVSKVVDDNGEPLVVYHGTDVAGFAVFTIPEIGERSEGVFTAAAKATATSYTRRRRARDVQFDDVAGGNRESLELQGYTFDVGKSGHVLATLPNGAEWEYTSESAALEGINNLARNGDGFSGTYALFLNIREPFETDFEGANWSGERIGQYEVVDEEGVQQHDNLGHSYFTDQGDAIRLAESHEGWEARPATDHYEDTNQAASEARANRNDGAIIRSVIDDGPGGGYGDPTDVFVVYDAANIKSADFNEGGFDPTDERIYRQDGEVFYSALLRAVETLQAKTMPAQGWQDTITGLLKAGKVKADEVEWSGITDWLDLQSQEPEPGPSQFVAYSGHTKGAPIMGTDLTTGKQLQVLWAGSTKAMASQFADGQITKLHLTMRAPFIVEDETRTEHFGRKSHARIVEEIFAEVKAGRAGWDGVVFKDTVDGMEVADVYAVFPPENGKMDDRVKVVETTTFDEDTGDEIISRPTRITKKQVTEYLAGNGVRVEEVVLGQPQHNTYGVTKEDTPHGPLFHVTRTEDGETFYNGRSHADEVSAQRAADGLNGRQPTKYHQYVQPGGENYREVLLTLPLAEGALSDAEVKRLAYLERLGYGIPNDEHVGESLRSEVADLRLRKKNAPQYKSSHWDQPNVLAHIRLNDRVDADGKRVLFVEEVQSDWGQSGKKQGFADGGKKAIAPGERTEFINRLRQGVVDRMVSTGIEREFAEGAASGLSHPSMANMLGVRDEYDDLLRREEIDRQSEKKVPAAPFVTATDKWLTLTLKRIIVMAAQEGYDRVAFINGEQSAERYDLSKQVDSLTLKDKQKTMGEPGLFVIAQRDGRNVIERTVADEKELADLVGKEVADRLLKSPLRGGERNLTGIDLKVGGPGMVAFYDTILPNTLKGVLKKVGGGQVEDVTIGQPAKYRAIQSDGDGGGEIVDADLETVEFHATIASARARALELNGGHLGTTTSTQPGFTLTPEMREKTRQGLPLFAGNPGAPKGQIAFGADITKQASIVSLLDGADLSTFNHEMGHLYLEVMTDLGQRIAAREQQGEQLDEGEVGLLKDIDVALNWMGLKDAGPNAPKLSVWREMTVEQKRVHHEQWARGWEAYLMEDRAPNLGMRRVYRTFANWMRQTYRALTGSADPSGKKIGEALRVNLSEEVRQVMDRFVATPEQIEEAQAAREMGALFKTADEAGMSMAEYKAYHDLGLDAMQEANELLQARSLRDVQWLSRARSRKIKALQKEHDALRNDIEAGIRTQVKGEPVYRAWDFLTTKADPNDPESATRHGKLRTSDVKAVGTPAATRLSELRMTSEENGLDPQLVAEQFGFDSGDALVRALAAAEHPESVIAGLTDQQMLAEHGDLATPEDIERTADEAIHNDARARFVATELHALEQALSVRKKTPGKRHTTDVLTRAAKDYAREVVAQTKVRDLRPGQYAAAAQRAAAAARRAIGDLAEAARHKRNQLINTTAAREATNAREEVGKMLDYFNRVQTPGRIPASHLAQISALLEKFDLRTSVTNAELDNQARFRTWVEGQLAQGNVPPNVELLLTKQQRAAYARELLQRDEEGNLVYGDEDAQAGLLASFVEETPVRSYKEVTVEELRGLRDAVKQIEHIGRRTKKVLTDRKNREFKSVVEAIANRIVEVAERTGREASDTRSPNDDKGKSRLSWRGFFFSHIKAANIAHIADGGAGGPMWEHLIATANRAADREAIEVGMAHDTVRDLLAPVLAQGDLTGKAVAYPSMGRSLNKQAIIAMALNLGNASNMQRLLGGEGWTLDDIKPALDALTKVDWEFVQGMWDYFETYRPRVGQMEALINGVEPQWVEPQPLTVKTADGHTLNLRGGYAPVIYDPRASGKAASHAAEKDAKSLMQAARVASTVGKSFTKARVAEVNGRPLMLALDPIIGGIQDTIHYLNWQPWVIDANRIVKAIDAPLRAHYGADAVSLLREWVGDNAAGLRPARDAAERKIVELSRNVSFAGLAFNFLSAVQQITGYTQSVVVIGGKWMGRGLARSMASPRQAYLDAVDKSEFMLKRASTRIRDLAEVNNTVQGQSAFRETLDRFGYSLMMTMQTAVDVPTWWGAYEKAIADNHDEADAVAMADQAVKDAQGSGLQTDLASVERARGALRLFTGFMSFMNTTLNVNYRVLRSEQSAAAKIVDLLLVNAIPVALTLVLKAAFTPGDSGDDDPEKIAKKYGAELASFLAGQMVGIREISQIGAAFMGEPQGQYGGAVGTRMAADILKLAKQVGQGEMDDALRKAIINAAGDLYRLPSAQLNRTITGFSALREGETSNPAALLFGYQKPQ